MICIVPKMSSILFLSVILSFAFADDCTVTNYDDVQQATESCSNIVIQNVDVPGGETFRIDLKNGATLTFEGAITFGVYNWKGPLLTIAGNAITVIGAPGSVLDGQGAKYWDGKGTGGVAKPKFFRIEASGGSTFTNINMKNCPVHCVSVGNSDQLTLDGWNVDVSDGDKDELGHNTDGFDVSANNVVIKNTKVYNQDDCIVVNMGVNMTFQNIYCSGGHGLSMSVGQSKNDGLENIATNVLFADSTVVNSDNGMHLKTHTDAGTGEINGLTYKNIRLEGIRKYGINIQEDYKGGSSSGTPKNNIPIKNLVFENITGTYIAGGHGIYILCADGGCLDWKWSDVDVSMIDE